MRLPHDRWRQRADEQYPHRYEVPGQDGCSSVEPGPELEQELLYRVRIVDRATAEDWRAARNDITRFSHDLANKCDVWRVELCSYGPRQRRQVRHVVGEI